MRTGWHGDSSLSKATLKAIFFGKEKKAASTCLCYWNVGSFQYLYRFLLFLFHGETLKTFKLSYITEEIKYNSKTLKDRDSVHICQAKGIAWHIACYISSKVDL